MKTKRPRTHPERPRNHPVIFDKDVAEFFGISLRTLQNRMLRPVAGELDLNDAHPAKVGGRRFWLRSSVERLAGMKVGEA